MSCLLYQASGCWHLSHRLRSYRWHYPLRVWVIFLRFLPQTHLQSNWFLHLFDFQVYYFGVSFFFSHFDEFANHFAGLNCSSFSRINQKSVREFSLTYLYRCRLLLLLGIRGLRWRWASQALRIWGLLFRDIGAMSFPFISNLQINNKIVIIKV